MRAAAAALCLVAGPAWSQPAWTPPQNVLQLSASATIEVPQDWLSLTLSTTREAADAATVQAQLKTALDAALAQARRQAQPGAMDVQTGNFSLAPRYNRDGRISAWQGTAELVLEGKDTARIAQVAGGIGSMTVGNVSFGLSREQRERVEAEAQSQAIANFRQKAEQLARDFGFSGYTLREVSVNANQNQPMRPRMMAMEAKAASDAPIPVEAGKASVIVNVNGSVQLK